MLANARLQDGDPMNATVPATAAAPAPAPYELMAQSLLRIHTALRRILDTIVRVSAAPVPEDDRAGFADFCAGFTRFLHAHHDGEEEVIFPKLTEVAARAGLPVYASDVTGWRADHKKLLGRLNAFETATAELRKGGSRETLARTAGEVRDVLYPHLAAEEAELDGAAFAKLLRADEVHALEVASSQHGQRVGGPGVLVMLVYALTDDEQKAQFGGMPWLVRKVLLKRIWARSFRRSLKYAHNQSIAL
jgi:hemerythrin-like domain-containing protein